jgi:hypothetical protein
MAYGSPGRQRAENLHLNQPPRGIEQTAGEHDVPGDMPVMLGNQRETIRQGDGLPQRIDQVSHHQSVVTERPPVDGPHRLPVAREFFAKIHARMVGRLPGRPHPVLLPAGRAE